MPDLPRLVSALSLALAAPLLAGWGAKGHAVVADIAWREIRPETRAAIEEILGPETIQQTASWADAVRGTDAYRFTAPFHYANPEPGAPSYDHARDCPEVGCVVSAVDRYAATLADEDMPRAMRAEALKFVVHFVGDLHQPLHGGRAADRGGNDIRITLRGRDRNLHSAWDSGLMDATDTAPWPIWSERLAAGISETDRLAWTIADAPKSRIESAGRWLFESHQLALAISYSDGADGELDEADIARAAPVIDLRLRQAGVRLARLLDQTLDAD
ncbi:MAG: S1/P1 nuclease [Planctomycetota bacterium]